MTEYPIWHPFTQMKDVETVPLIPIVSASGNRLYDAAGNWYYDTISSWWCVVHGHSHPDLVAAAAQQMAQLDHVLFAGFTHEPARVLAESLIRLTPTELTRVYFSDNGSTAVEVALKMSFQYWKQIGYPKKQRFICFDYGYHGDTIGAMSVSGPSVFNAVFEPLLFPSHNVNSPYCYRCPANRIPETCHCECLQPLSDLLYDKQDEIAGMILEPLLMGAGGMIIYPAKVVSRIAELCRQANVHLIYDEIATGFGRTGTLFALEQTGTCPDFLCVSKGITSGMLSLAATLTTDTVYQAFFDDYLTFKTFYHGHTYTANPVACAIANASLTLFHDHAVLDQIQPVMTHFGQQVQRFRGLKRVGDVRHLGMVAAFELVADCDTKALFSVEDRIGYQVYQQGLKHNLILRPLGHVVYLFLPLCTTIADIDDILDRVWMVLQ